ncbi:hypothetical protein [Nocardiopsis sp. CNR-923]|uniref:hypothetical protein n=1 Tax=Nocardiopsis sp. CNR-923 TaxID=1904965 RepID=UPI001300DEA3|nr:hypothetical protein [Nocardiopsis sp. CNR-923]
MSSPARAWMFWPTLGGNASSRGCSDAAGPFALSSVLAAATASLRDSSVRPLAAWR